MSAMISISSLNKSFGNKQVLKDVTLTVEPGQILGIVGPNGAGKTTCLQAILGLDSFQGEISVLGYNPQSQRHLMLNEVAYISDVAVLPKWIKVSQALSYMQSVHPNFNRNKAEAFIVKTKITNDSKVGSLSKGMITQLHLALILAIEAKVLILDEPTLGLDLLTRHEFYHQLLEEFYDDEKAIIVTTHQIEEIEHILTDVAFIREGEVVLAESVDAIRERFTLLEVANEQAQQAQSFKPLLTNSMMGLTSMLFDQVEQQQLAALGKVTTPTLADIFIGMMNKEKQA